MLYALLGEGAICRKCREREPFAKKGTISRRGSHLLYALLGEGAICKKCREIENYSQERRNQCQKEGASFQKVQREGTIFKEKELVTKRREPFAGRGIELQEVQGGGTIFKEKEPVTIIGRSRLQWRAEGREKNQ